jgi:hypothetical protein
LTIGIVEQGAVMTEQVHDWATDYDIFDPGYIADPFPVWDDLRDADRPHHR